MTEKYFHSNVAVEVVDQAIVTINFRCVLYFRDIVNDRQTNGQTLPTANTALVHGVAR